MLNVIKFSIHQLLFCLMRYQGDEKIKTFIWDLIAPIGTGTQQKIDRNHSGLHNLVPRGRNAKGGKYSKSENIFINFHTHPHTFNMLIC